MSALPRFVLMVLAWLPVTFAVWYFAAPILMWPVALIVDLVGRIAFGDIVKAVDQSGATLMFTTSLRPGQSVSGGVVTADINMLLYSFGLPLFAALTLAAREPHRTKVMLIGYAILIPAVAFSVLSDFLKSVSITAATQVVSQVGFSAWQREAIAFCYQFGSLILPAVAPAVIWVLSHRAFLERLRRTSAS